MNTAAPTLRHSLPGTATGTCHRPCHPKKKHAGLSAVMAILLCLLASCHYQRPDLEGKDLSKSTRDSLTYLYERHYTWNTNLVVRADSVSLQLLPLKDTYCKVSKDDHVVVAEFAVHPSDSVDSIWVKLAHSQNVQGWIRECDLMRQFAPTDSISQAIYLFSDTHASYFIIVFALFVAAWLIRAFRHKRLHMVFYNDIDSIYPMLLCLLMACSATLYESMQVFVPDTWQHFYFNPTLSPFKVPPVLSAFLFSLWLFLMVLLAVIDDLFRQLSFTAAAVYLLGLASACIFCYFFFIFTTPFYVGYAFLAAFAVLFLRRVYKTLRTPRYRCGRCGCRLAHKGTCPQCGVVNE